jgi:hypothetical protein
MVLIKNQQESEVKLKKVLNILICTWKKIFLLDLS